MPTSEKRKVTMSSEFPGLTVDGKPAIQRHEATDYVPLDILDAYVADAKTRWQSVEVGDSSDAGPGGHDGETTIPANIEKENN